MVQLLVNASIFSELERRKRECGLSLEEEPTPEIILRNLYLWAEGYSFFVDEDAKWAKANGNFGVWLWHQQALRTEIEAEKLRPPAEPQTLTTLLRAKTEQDVSEAIRNSRCLRGTLVKEVLSQCPQVLLEILSHSRCPSAEDRPSTCAKKMEFIARALAGRMCGLSIGTGDRYVRDFGDLWCSFCGAPSCSWKLNKRPWCGECEPPETYRHG